jgi:hypothetical protein
MPLWRFGWLASMNERLAGDVRVSMNLSDLTGAVAQRTPVTSRSVLDVGILNDHRVGLYGIRYRRTDWDGYAISRMGPLLLLPTGTYGLWGGIERLLTPWTSE